MKAKKSVVIYGVGNYYKKYEREINNEYKIVAFIDRDKHGQYNGKAILNMNDINQLRYDKIIIMVQSIQECINIAKELITRGVSSALIDLGHCTYGSYSNSIDKIIIISDGTLMLKFNDVSIKIKSQDEFNNVCEVFDDQIYNYYINSEKKDIVIDIGMNIGDSVLYFANSERVDKVYGYEPFRKTYEQAAENLEYYLESGNVDIFHYGISDEDATRYINFNKDMTCGQSTLESVRQCSYEKYQEWGLAEEKNEKIEQIEVRKASKELEPILNRYIDHNVVLKMDCEGEEYGILEDLMRSGLLGRFKFIMLEWHYRGKEPILGCLQKAGFSWWCNDKSKDMGLVYAYK